MPTKLLELRGSWRAKTRPDELQPPPASVTPPEWLTQDAVEVWQRLVPRLYDLGLFTVLDVEAVGRYCTHFAQWHKAITTLHQRGQTYPLRDVTGKVVGFREYPEVRIATRNAEILFRLEREFGMTPSARAALKLQLANFEPTEKPLTTVSARGRKPKQKAALSVG